MTEAMQVGVLGGTKLPGNVRTLLVNLRRLLRSHEQRFECDLIVSRSVEPVDGYRTVRIDHGPVETARDRLRLLRDAASRYATDQWPDVLLQVTRFPTHGSAVALAGWRTDTPTVARLAGDNFREYQFATDPLEKLRTFALKNVLALLAIHLPDAVIVLGPGGRRDLKRRLRRTGVWEIPQPIDQTQFCPGEAHGLRESLSVDPAERLLLTVGRVSRRKGAETIRKVAPSFEGTWLVVGDGPMRETLADTPGVRALGRVPHDRIVDFYRVADLYVHPSLHEGLPNVLLEATACGTPCIARDVGECGTVAVDTFSDDAALRAALNRTYAPVELDEQFRDDRLAKRYAAVLTEVAR